MTIDRTWETWRKKSGNGIEYGVIVNFEKTDNFSNKYQKIIFWVGNDNRPLNAISEDVKVAYELAKEEAQSGYTRDISILCGMARLLGGRASKWDIYSRVFS